jgi:type IV secretion system protein VirB9
MRKALLLLSLLALPAQADTLDRRLILRAFHENAVVRIESRPGVETTIAFGENEHIENVAIGDANLWQITPNKRTNMLFIKPLVRRGGTNLTVVTDQHAYFFDLAATPSGRPTYLLRFTYPAPPPISAPPPLTREEAAIAQGELTAQGAPVDPASLDFGWRMKGKEALFPTRLFSDGQATYLAWPAATPQPAILIMDAKGVEGPVNYTVHGDVIAVPAVPAAIILRSGRDRAILEHINASKPAPAAKEGP